MVQCIVREDLGLHPSTLQMLQSLTPFSKQRQPTFAQTFRTHLEKHPGGSTADMVQ